MRAVTVESILWEGRHGGAIFNAALVDGSRFRIVASAEVMPRPPITGEVWEVGGVVRQNPAYGPQVEANRALLLKPSGRLLIRAIATSKAFPGIGEARAKALWDWYGEGIYPLLEAGETGPFEGLLGSDLAQVLVRGWAGMAAEAEVFRWLEAHGLPVRLASKLLDIYGLEAVRTLEENPYRLLAFTSWQEAERLARSMRIPADDLRRLVAAVDAVSLLRLSFSHTWGSSKSFRAQIRSLLGSGESLALKALERAVLESAVVPVGEGYQGLGLYTMECFVAHRVHVMLKGEFKAAQMTLRQEPTASSLSEVFKKFRSTTGIELNDLQCEAVRMAVSTPLGCITGGAGVGKTTVLRAIHVAAEVLGFSGIYQMALSGRAAKRMEESTGRRAHTIAAFLVGVDNGLIDLEGEVMLVVDEASMLDLPLCYRIMRRMPPGARLLLVGDPAQLPPIGFGLTFHVLAGRLGIPTIELAEVHRQAAETGIPAASLTIREGAIPRLRSFSGRGVGVSFLETTPNEALVRIAEVVNDLGGIGACQIIGAVKNGPVGVRTINHYFHGVVAAGRPTLGGFAEGEPVIWTVNDYERGLFNGSFGTVVGVGDELSVEFDGRLHILDGKDLHYMEHAYAITVHKSQGSQFERVVVPLFRSRLLDRALLYTAITRAERQVVLLGNRDAFGCAVESQPVSSRRETGLGFHLEDHRA